MLACQLSTEADDFKAYHLDRPGRAAVDEFFGRPSEGRWRPLRLSADRQNKRVPAGDFPCIFNGNSMPALSQRAVDALRDLLEPVGELLPVECPDGRLWLFNCLRFADVLDEEHCDLTRSEVPGLVLHIRRYAWKPEAEHETLFRLPQRRRSSVYVTDAVAERIRSAGLVGYELIECRT